MYLLKLDTDSVFFNGNTWKMLAGIKLHKFLWNAIHNWLVSKFPFSHSSLPLGTLQMPRQEVEFALLCRLTDCILNEEYLFLILFIHPDTMLTEVFQQCYLKAFISLRQAAPQNCQSTAGSCNDKAFEWRSEPRPHSTSSTGTAAWPRLKCSFAYFPARLYLSLPQDCKHQVQLMQSSEHQSYTTALPTCGKLVLQRGGWGPALARRRLG